MLFDSTVKRELAKSFGATLVVILTVMLTMFLIRTVGQAAGGVVSPQDVVLLLGFVSLGHLPTMLALSLFIAVVVTLGRMYRDSEMVIWFASGVNIHRFIVPVLRMAWPVVVVIALLVVFVWPWSNQQTQELRDRYQQRSDIARVAPGVFQSSSDGQRVFFVEREGADTVNARNVFILSRQNQNESVTSAHRGHLQSVGDDRFLVLEAGQRNEINMKTFEKTQASFETYRVLAEEKLLGAGAVRPPKATATAELIRRNTAESNGELAWRGGLLLAACNMVLLGIGLAASNPRRPSNWGLVFALLTFVVYYFNVVNLSQVWVAAGRMSLVGALLGMHGAVLLLALALLWWRNHGAVFRWPSRRLASS